MTRHALRPAIEQHQDRIFARTQRAANAAERAVRGVWSELLAVMRAGGPYAVVWHQVQSIVASLPYRVRFELADDLAELGRQSHALAVSAIADHLPARASDRLRTRLHEDLGGAEASKIFPAPSLDTINRIIFSSGWQDRVGFLTRLADPGVLATQIATGLSQGQTVQQIAAAVRPAVQGVQTSARRVARTEGMRVAHEIQMEAYEDLGELVVGYQIHATLDEHTRPWHRRRDGTTYYRDPKPGQKGFAQMPRPPMESPDLTDRPPRTPFIAPNCRCYVTPVLDI